MEEKLKKLGISKAWITNKLSSENIYNIRDVFIAQIDDNGNIYIDLYNKEK